MTKVFFIAEAGVNHNGSEKLAKKLIDIAAISGADAVKFQTFKADQILSRRTKKASYQVTSKQESRYAMIKKLELSFSTFERIVCLNAGIPFRLVISKWPIHKFSLIKPNNS